MKLDRIINYYRQGLEVGDWCLDDEGIEASLLNSFQPLVTGPRAVVYGGGRIKWDLILMGAPFPVVFEKGWNERGRPVMDPWGVLYHWTAGKPTEKRPAPSLNICLNGRDNIPGPLIHLLVAYNGKVHVCASGRANHAGLGHVNLLNDIRANKAPGKTARQKGLVDTGGSAGRLIGVEIENDGTKPFTPMQVATLRVLYERFQTRGLLPVNAAKTWTHVHWTRRKIDITGRQWPV